MLTVQQRAAAGLDISKRSVVASPVCKMALRWRAVRAMAAAAGKPVGFQHVAAAGAIAATW
jgi:hypothetical protein